MLWPWKHARLHRQIKEAHMPWAPGEQASCWVCGTTWTADLRHPGVLHVTKTKNNKAPR